MVNLDLVAVDNQPIPQIKENDMARLEAGVDPKIDRINELVRNSYDKDNMGELISTFKPMLISICSKWTAYFNSCMPSHIKVKFGDLKPFNELMSDAEYWFIIYTREKYDVNGDATYNNFIKKHIDQRIRYICEREMGYYMKNTFPDPSHSENDDGNTDIFETVIYNYSSTVSDVSNTEDTIIEDIVSNSRSDLAKYIINIVNSGSFTDREKMIFNEVMCGGMTQEDMRKKLNVSRMRVMQIIKKIKIKLYRVMNGDQKVWDLINDTDIKFDEQ